MDRYRDVKIIAVVETMDHCSTECNFLEHGGKHGICTVFGSLAYDEKRGDFQRHPVCRMSEV